MNRARSCKAVRSRGAKCQVWKEQQGQQRLPSHRRLGFAPSFCLLEPVLDQSLSPSLGHPGILKGCTAGVLNAPATVGMALAKGYIQGMTAKDRRLLLSYLPCFIPSTRGDQKYTKIHSHSTSYRLHGPPRAISPPVPFFNREGWTPLANMSPTAHRQTSIALCARPSTAITGS